MLQGKSDAILAAAVDAAVVAHIAEPKLIHQRGSEDVDVGQHALRGVIDGGRAAADETGEASDRGPGILSDGKSRKQIVPGREGLVDTDIALVGARARGRLAQVAPRQRSSG